MAGPVLPRRGPETGQKWLDELLLGLEVPSPAGMAVGPSKAAARQSIAELVEMIRSGKIQDWDLVPEALRALKAAGKPKGIQAVAKGAQPLSSASTLQASIGKFQQPWQIGAVANKAQTGKLLRANKPLKYSAVAGSLGALGLSQFPGEEEAPYDPGDEWRTLDLDSLKPSGVPAAKPRGGVRRRPRPDINSLLPAVQEGFPEGLGDQVNPEPEGLEFLQGRNPARSMAGFFPDGQDTKNQEVLGFTGNQQLPEQKKNKNLLLSLLKGLW